MPKLSVRIELQLLQFLQRYCKKNVTSHVHVLAKAIASLQAERVRLKLAFDRGEDVSEARDRLNQEGRKYGALLRIKIRGTRRASFRTNISNETAAQVDLLSSLLEGNIAKRGRIVGFALGRYLAERGYAPIERKPDQVADFQLPFSPISSTIDKLVKPFLATPKRSIGGWPEKALLPKWARGELVLLDPSFLLVLFNANRKAKLILQRLLEGAASAAITTAILSPFAANALSVLLQFQNLPIGEHRVTEHFDFSPYNCSEFRTRLQALLACGLEAFPILPEDFTMAIPLQQQIEAEHGPDVIRYGRYRKADLSVLVSLVAIFRQTDRWKVGVLTARTADGRYKFEWERYDRRTYEVTSKAVSASGLPTELA